MLIQKHYSKFILVDIRTGGRGVRIYSFTEQAKGRVLDFSKGTVKVL